MKLPIQKTLTSVLGFLLVALPFSAKAADATIVLASPSESSVVASPLTIQGTTNETGNVYYRLRDQNGSVLAQGIAKTDTTSTGSYKPFTAVVPFTSPNGGSGTLEVFTYSTTNGTEIHKTAIGIRFAGASSSTPSLNTGPLLPLYRLYNKHNLKYLLTTSVSERDAAINRFGFINEGIIGYIFTQPGEGLVPLYRLYQGKTGDHFFTTNFAERNFAIARLGYIAEGITGYVDTNAVVNSIPLYRLYQARYRTHFYTMRTDEQIQSVSLYGYRAEKIEGYLQQ